MASKHVCPVCVIQIIQSDKSIQCEDDCKRFFHQECAKLSNTDYSKYANPRTNEFKKWICRRDDCMDVGKQPMNQILSQLSFLASKISDLTDKVDLITSLPSKVDNLITEVESLNGNLQSLDLRVTTNESKIEELERKILNTKTVHGAPDTEATIAEINERERRSRNVILYNLPESKNNTASVRIEHDSNLISKIIAKFCPSDSEASFKSYRIGRPLKDRSRPLKVIFKKSTVVMELCKNFSPSDLVEQEPNLRDVGISRDRTPAERKYLQELRATLKEMTDSGEADLTIKFVNGVPKIVKSSPKNY